MRLYLNKRTGLLLHKHGSAPCSDAYLDSASSQAYIITSPYSMVQNSINPLSLQTTLTRWVIKLMCVNQ